MSGKQMASKSFEETLYLDIEKILAQGKQRAATAVNQILVETYWHIGKRISAENLSLESEASEALLMRLADKLNMDYSTLSRTINFYQLYPKLPAEMPLHWSHYKILIPITDTKKRKWYETYAIENKLSKVSLQKAVRNGAYENRGLLKNTKTKPAKIIKRPTEPTYIYKAIVEQVVDGDTLVARIDLGFQVWKNQRIRLAQIDCDEIDSKSGQKACAYVVAALKKVDFIMIKTTKIDIYGRYIADIFYSTKKLSKDAIFLKGNYLNEELVARGLARTYY